MTREQYFGFVKDDYTKHGFGIYTDSDGNISQGVFNDGKIHGAALLIQQKPSKMKFLGIIENDLKQGEGKLKT